MRAFAFFSAASLALAAPLEAAAPARVASLNLCTDELLLMLAATGQIVSVTHLSRQPEESPLWRRARRYRANDGSLLSVAPLRPDLVLTMGGGARDRPRVARRLGIATLDLPYPADLAALERSIVRLAEALGRPERGAALAAGIEELRRTAPPARTDALWLGGGGLTFGPESLGAQWMALAGLRQRAAGGDRVSLEQLIARPPAVLLRSDYRSGQYSGGQRWLSHPAARRPQAGRNLATDGRLWTCMGPLLVAEIARLRSELER